MRQLNISPPISFNPHTQQSYSPIADLVFRITKSSREENSQPVQESPPSCQQSAAILSTYVISPELRTYLLIMQAKTQRNVWTLVAKFANSSSNLKILLFAASPLMMFFTALSRCPSTTRAALQATQLECPHLWRTHSHLCQGTRPSKKATRTIDVKRYLKDVVITADGLLVVRDHQPFQPPRERPVVPRSVLDGLLTALHIRFSHPSKYQMKRLFSRYFFALDVDKAIDLVSSSCHTCESVKSIPKQFQPQSSVEAPSSIGISFAADVSRRHRPLILVVRETVSSYTLTALIQSEKHEDLRNALIVLCSQLRSLHDGGPQSVLTLPLVFVHLPPTQSSIAMALPWRSAGSRIQTRILSRNAPLRSLV